MADKEFLERVRKARNREVMSEFIRVGQSDLYDYEPVRRAVLKEIAFLQVNDENTKVPKDSPFKGQYEGWCYASERFLANRVGTTEGYVRNSVALMEKDGVITTRLWHDPMGYPHQEYHVIEEKVTEHQRAEGFMEYECKAPRRGGNKQANKGSFKLGNKVRATAHDSRSHRTPQPLATAHDSRMPPHSTAVSPPHSTADSGTAVRCDKAVIDLGGLSHQGGSGSGSYYPASALASVPSAPDGAVGKRESAGDGSVLPKQEKQNVKGIKPQGASGKKPLPNRLCYPEAFKGWRPGMKVPKCNRCGDNLQPEENHVCEGFVPKYPMGKDTRESLQVFCADED